MFLKSEVPVYGCLFNPGQVLCVAVTTPSRESTRERCDESRGLPSLDAWRCLSPVGFPFSLTCGRVVKRLR